MTKAIRGEPNVDSKDIIRVLLDETHTTEPPTNAEAIARHLGLAVIGFSHHEYNLDHRIRAFLWPARGLIGVDRKLTQQRRTYSILHEIGHYVLPGHIPELSEDDKIVDEDRTLSTATPIMQEIEANQFAADCLFQLDRFDLDILHTELNWRNIRIKANIYGASFEATARRWVEKSPEECALLVFNPTSSEKEAPLRIMYTVTSESFAKKYFSKIVPGWEISSDSLAYKVFYQLDYWDEPEEELHVVVDDDIHRFSMRLFTNTYRMFGLLIPIE